MAVHVDRIKQDPLSAEPERLLERLPPDSPKIGKQEREGWATYVRISEPHTMAECPFTDRRFELEFVSPVPGEPGLGIQAGRAFVRRPSWRQRIARRLRHPTWPRYYSSTSLRWRKATHAR